MSSVVLCVGVGDGIVVRVDDGSATKVHVAIVSGVYDVVPGRAALGGSLAVNRRDGGVWYAGQRTRR